LQGIKTFEQVVIPENAEVKQLPPITFSFFDPGQKGYHSVTQSGDPDRRARQHSGPGAANRFGDRGPEPKRAETGDRHRSHQNAAGMFAQIRPPLIRQTWFVAMQGAPPSGVADRGGLAKANRASRQQPATPPPP